jgi:FkbM family methyltransferase
MSMPGNSTGLTRFEIYRRVFSIMENPFAYILDSFGITGKAGTEYRLKNGIRLMLRGGHIDRYVFREIWVFRCYTPAGFGISPDDVVLDIGANVGIFSAYASALAKNGKVYSLEPDPINFSRLQETLAVNGMKNASAFNCAVGAASGTAVFFQNDGNRTLGSLSGAFGSSRRMSVKAVSLGDFVAQEGIKKIDFLKIDCEGAEYDIFKSCPDKVLRIIRRISMEYHPSSGGFGLEGLIQLLEKIGFRVKVVPGSGGFGMLYASR